MPSTLQGFCCPTCCWMEVLLQCLRCPEQEGLWPACCSSWPGIAAQQLMSTVGAEHVRCRDVYKGPICGHELERMSTSEGL